jgi:hypothetical protein
VRSDDAAIIRPGEWGFVVPARQNHPLSGPDWHTTRLVLVREWERSLAEQRSILRESRSLNGA